MKRRALLKAIATGILAVAAAPAYGTWIEPSLLDIVEIQIPLHRVGPGMQGLRAVQLSDLHVGPWFTQSRLQQVVEQVSQLKPELVFITGDFITRGGDYPSMKQALFDPLRTLARQVPVFSVLGNHDYYRKLNTDISEMLTRAGVVDVTNTVLPYRRGDDLIYFAGVGSAITGNMRLEKIVREIPKGTSAILLAHEPDVAQRAKETPEFVLQLSGHTHGGQVILPFIGPVVLPNMGKLYPLGLYDLGSMYVYTNRGLGMTHLAFRLNCPPEITVFTFTQENAAEPRGPG